MALLLGGFAGPAWACGACVSPPAPPGSVGNFPVLQDAERVLFFTDKKTKRSVVWVEVRYGGLAKDFGWIVPVPKAPKVSVGTSLVFDVLDQESAARFPLKFSVPENCRDPRDGCDYPGPPASGIQLNAAGSGSSGGGFADAGASAAADSASRPPAATVNVVSQGVTGPYNYAVLQAGGVEPLMKWLEKNGYKIDKKATAVIDSHVKKGDSFVAVKLSNDAGVNQIKPIVLTMDDAEPCVPLRLTSVAAVDDMSVVVTVAGSGRAIVKNHLDVRINPIKLDVFNKSSNYGQVASEAIDEAGGHAFITEYSKPGAKSKLPGAADFAADEFTKVSNGEQLAIALRESPSWILHPDSVAIIDESVDVMTTIKPLLKQTWNGNPALETPAQVLSYLWTCGNFFMATGNPTCNWQGWRVSRADLQALKIDGAKIAKRLDEEIAAPAAIALDALGSAARVTRLVLRIDPDEMDRDPVFAFNKELAEVDNVHNVVANNACATGFWPADQVRVHYANFGTWLFDVAGESVTNAWASPSSFTDVRPALDKRFEGAPFALGIALQDETGAAVNIAKADIELVDTAIIGAQIGNKALPDGMTLNKAEPWQPPKDDGLLTAVRHWCPPDNACIPRLGWAPGKVPVGHVGAGAGPGASVCTHKQTRDDRTAAGGCSAAQGQRGNGAVLWLMLLAAVAIYWRRVAIH